MTMPSERTRALRWAGEFLQEAMEVPELPLELKRQIRTILRHYPSASEIAHQARYGGQAAVIGRWLGPEDPARAQDVK